MNYLDEKAAATGQEANEALREWAALKDEARRLLIAVAKRTNPVIAYSDFASQLTTIRLRAQDKRLFDLLCEISEEEDASGRGMLSATVVHKTRDRMPGLKFYTLAEKLGRNATDKRKCWRAELEKVSAHWKSTDAGTTPFAQNADD